MNYKLLIITHLIHAEPTHCSISEFPNREVAEVAREQILEANESLRRSNFENLVIPLYR